MLAIALPMVISNACDTAMIFTDRLFLSRVGPQYMSAAMGGGLTCFTMTTFFIGLTGYCTALAAQYFGAGRKSVCPLVITQGLILSGIAWPIILVARPLALWLFQVTGIPPEQLGPQIDYFSILLWGSAQSLSQLSGLLFSGIGKPVRLWSLLTSTVVNIVSNYVLIFGKWGFSPLGIRAAYGTLLGSACGLLVLILVYLSKT